MDLISSDSVPDKEIHENLEPQSQLVKKNASNKLSAIDEMPSISLVSDSKSEGGDLSSNGSMLSVGTEVREDGIETCN